MNSSVSEILIRNEPNLYVGKQFLSLVYILVDYDTMEYTFWKANATNNVNLVAVGGDCTDEHSSGGRNSTGGENSSDSGSSSSEGNGSGTGSHTSAQSGNSRSNGGSLSTGATAGIVVGAVTVIVLVAAAVWLVWRKRRQASRGTSRFDHAPSGSIAGAYPLADRKETTHKYHELPPDCRPYEVDGGKFAQVHEMQQPSSELP